MARVAALARLADFATGATETTVAVLTDESIARNPTLNVPETHEKTRALAEPIQSNLNRLVSRGVLSFAFTYQFLSQSYFVFSYQD